MELVNAAIPVMLIIFVNNTYKIKTNEKCENKMNTFGKCIGVHLFTSYI